MGYCVYNISVRRAIPGLGLGKNHYPGSPYTTPSVPPQGSNGPAPPGGDLLTALSGVLAQDTPALVLVYGDPGSGKSSLLRALIPRVEGPAIFVAYRAVAGTRSAPVGPANPATEVALLLLDPARVIADGNAEREPSGAIPVSFVPAGVQPGHDGFPPQISEAIEQMLAAGGGTIFVDSWDRRSEEEYRERSGVRSGGLVITSAVAPLQEQLGRIPVHAVVAMIGAPDAGSDSLADISLSLGHEEIDGNFVHRLHVEKAARDVGGRSDLLFSTVNGEFYCPAPQEPPPIGGVRAPDPEAESVAGTFWPGSAEYARAFGRLRFNGYTVLELLDDAPSAASGALGFPMVAWTLLRGGRVVWIPSPMMSHGRIARILAGIVPPDQLRQNLRVLSAAAADSSLGDLRSIALPVRRAAKNGADPRTVDAAPVEPLFPEAYNFLRARPGDGLSLFVLAVDGLRALSSTSGNTYDPATFPLLVERYARIEHFHGLGIVHGEDPLARGVLPTADTWLRVRQRHGQTVVTGMRPKTPTYLMDWKGELERYTLRALN